MHANQIPMYYMNSMRPKRSVTFSRWISLMSPLIHLISLVSLERDQNLAPANRRSSRRRLLAMDRTQRIGLNGSQQANLRPLEQLLTRQRCHSNSRSPEVGAQPHRHPVNTPPYTRELLQVFPTYPPLLE